jgi:epoxyqueuosine reductase
MSSEMIGELEARGYQARIVSARRIRDLRETIEGGRASGLLGEEFYRESLSVFKFEPPEGFQDVRSVIVASFRDPPTRLTFARAGRRYAVVVPPTYLHGRDKDGRLESVLSGLLAARGCRLAPAPLPKKLLAVRSGLAQYGKNNITYVAGTGSFHRLVAFFSDFPCEQDEWRSPQALPRCEGCLACAKRCPSGAIDQDRFLLRVERCITYWNEKPCQVAFPEWMEGSWHNCLVGCMLCQNVCPENREVVDWCEEGEQFSEADTGLLLKGTPSNALPQALVEKLKRCDLLESLDVLPRNLGVLLHPE